jgi:hypothetical protein
MDTDAFISYCGVRDGISIINVSIGCIERKD